MSSLSAVAAQILDKLCQAITGPVVGTVTCTASADTSVPIGQMGTLPDGRRVRCIRRKVVGTGGGAVAVRLEHLSPSYPAANNFRAVPAGTVVTWVDPPTNVAATGTTSAFGSGANAGTIKCGAIVEHDSAETAPAIFASGAANLTSALVLVSPTVRRIGPDGIVLRGLYEATWRLRMVFADIAETREREVRARDAFDAIVNSAAGGVAGDDVIRIGGWNPVRAQSWGLFWEAPLLTRVQVEGPILLDTSDANFEGLDASVLLPEDADQTPPFRVLDDIDT